MDSASPSQLSLIILECQIVPLGVDYINQGEGENISPGCRRAGSGQQQPLRSPLQKGHKMTISVAQRIEQAVAKGWGLGLGGSSQTMRQIVFVVGRLGGGRGRAIISCFVKIIVTGAVSLDKGQGRV